MAKRTCSVDGCDRPHNANGLCQTHEKRLKKYGTTDPPPEKPRACGHERTPENTLVDKNGKKRCKPCREEYKATHVSEETCSAPGCDRPVTANGLCNRDYQRMANKGSTEDRVLLTPEERKARQSAATNRWNTANRELLSLRRRQKYWGTDEPQSARAKAPSGSVPKRERQRRGRPPGPQRTPEELRQADRDRARRYREANPEKVAAYNRRWTIENPGKRSELSRKWVAANPDEARANWSAKRARRLGLMRATASGKVSYKAILAEFGMVCHLCGGEIASRADLEYDHVIPLSRGGPHVTENIRPSHKDCNREKTDKLMSELG